MYGDKNPGLLICRCLDKNDKSPIEGAGVILTWIQGEAIYGGRLQLYNLQNGPVDSVEADTDSAGVAFVQFLWDPLHFDRLLSSTPPIRVSAVGPAARHDNWFNSNQTNKAYLTERVSGKNMYECVNLGQVMNGGKGDFQFKSNEAKGIDALSNIKKILEFRAKKAGEKIPKLPMLKIMNPAQEMLSLIGGFDIEMTPQ